MSAQVSNEFNKAMVIEIEGVVGATDGAIGAIANPEGATLVVMRTTLIVEENSDGAANLSCGIAATPTGAANDIINALAMAAAEGKAFNGHARQNTAKTQIAAPALWTADKYLNFTGSASTVGLKAKLLVEYVRL